MKSKKKFFAGVDSGGTKCEVLIASDDLKILATDSYKGTHYSLTGAMKYSEDIGRYILHTVQKAGLSMSSCMGVCVGAAGAREDHDRNDISRELERLTGVRTIVTTDAMTALAGSFDGGDGIILISGTGSVLYGLSKGKVYRVGGWGRVIGDEGSGFWIGRKALNAAAREFDEKKSTGKNSRLVASLKEEFGLDGSNMNSMIFKGKLEVQSIAPVVLKNAKKGCATSRRIVYEAVAGLMWHIETFMKISGRKEPIDIAFTGSIIENENLLSRKLKKEISETANIRVCRRRHSPSFGAVLILAEKFNTAKII